jgi:tetratricopeptide (TPR) repeat protein
MPPPDRFQTWIAPCFALSLLVAVGFTYQPAWRGGLLWDDDMHLPSPALQSLDGLGRIWGELKATPQYYPVVYSTFWLEHRLWGDHTLGYHLVNILLHGLNALLVWLILRQLSIPGAMLAAAIFALHPVQVESVAWISELKNTLSGVFYLAALAAYLRFDQTRSRPWYTVALMLFALALLSKTVTATLPAALLVVFWWKRGHLSWRRDVLLLAPFFLLAIAGGLLSAWMEHEAGAQGAEFNCTALERCLIAGRAAWFYAAKLFWPAELVFIYPRWQVNPGAWWQYLYPLAAVLLLVALWRLRRRTRAPLAAVLYFGGTLFPALGFLNVYPFRYSFVADHFQYLACLGPIVLASAGLAILVEQRRRIARWTGHGACLGLAIVLGILTWRQSAMYRDIETLYSTTIARNPLCWMAHNNLGLILGASGHAAESLEHFREAVRLNPLYAEGNNNLGNALFQAGRPAEAIDYFQAALRIIPEYHSAHDNLGNALSALGRLDEAVEHYQAALRLKPDYADGLYNWGLALSRSGRFLEAIQRYEQATQIQPDHPKAHTSWGNALYQLGRLDEAIQHYQHALRIQPDAATHNNLGLVQAQRGLLHEAIEHYKTALKLDPNYAPAHNHWAIALSTLNRPSEAIDHFREALHIQPDYAAALRNCVKALVSADRIAEAVELSLQAVRRLPNQSQFYSDAAWLMATHNPTDGWDPNRAVELAERACAMTFRQDIDCLDTLAAAYASTGRFAEAVATAKQAWDLAKAAGQTSLAEELHMRLQLYRDHKPYRRLSHKTRGTAH